MRISVLSAEPVIVCRRPHALAMRIYSWPVAPAIPLARCSRSSIPRLPPGAAMLKSRVKIPPRLAFARPRRPFRVAAEILEARIAPALASPFNVGAVNGTNGFHISPPVGEVAGRVTAAAGDVNGDGLGDLILGGEDAAYILFGSAAGFPPDLDLGLLDGTNGFALTKAPGASFGSAVAGAGDVNGDGFADFLVGAEADSAGRGSVFLIYGHGGTFAASQDVATLSAAQATKFRGVHTGGQAGAHVSSAGDFNADGYADFIVGAPGVSFNGLPDAGTAYVVFGSPAGRPGTVDLYSSLGREFYGTTGSGFLGSSVAAAGDVNGDGSGDIILGSEGFNGAAGRAYVLYGPGPGSSGLSYRVANITPAAGFRIGGADFGANLGHSVSGAGDLNGDGYADVVVGAPGVGDLEQGAAYVIFGRKSPVTTTVDVAKLNGANGFRIRGELSSGQAGSCVAGAGDFNGDGFDDLLLGAFNQVDPAGDRAYLVYGQPTFSAVFPLGGLNGANGAVLTQFSLGDSVDFGDVNGDGLGDAILSNLNTGAHVVFGSASPAVTLTGDGGANTLTGTSGIDIIVAGAGDDEVNGAGGADVLLGGEGDDVLAVSDVSFRRILGGAGADTLRLDGAGLTLDLTKITASRLHGIERIDLTGAGANSLLLGPRDVIKRSGESNALTIDGNAGDSVDIGFGWTRAGTETIDGAEYVVYTYGIVVSPPNGREMATLKIAAGVRVTPGAAVLLTELDGADGFQTSRSDGRAAPAGDMNGDGFDDFMLSNGDKVHVVFGQASGFPAELDLATLNGTNGFVITPAALAAHEVFGFSLSAAGDFNGDGFGDLLLSSVLFGDAGNFNGPPQRGDAYLVFGHAAPFPPSFSVAGLTGQNGFKLAGPSTLNDVGHAVSGAGDLNADGYDDILISNPLGAGGRGEVYAVFGAAGGFTAEQPLSARNGANGFRVIGPSALNECFGFSLSSAGDLNGDGFGDFAIGGSGGVGYSRAAPSGAWAVFGKAGGFPAAFGVGSLNGRNGFKIAGGVPFNYLGVTVAGGGDVNGDGFDDLAIGGHLTSYVVLGKRAPFAPSVNVGALNGKTGFRLQAEGTFPNHNGAVSLGGDFNGDGLADLIVGGSPFASDPAMSGALVHGRAAFPAVVSLAKLRAEDGFAYKGVFQGTAAFVDVNGDGLDDILLGPGNRAFVYFGIPSPAATHLGDASANTLTGDAGANLLLGRQGNDQLIGNGGADVLRGGQGDDLLAIADLQFKHLHAGRGADTLRLDADAALTLDLTKIAGPRLRGFERIDLTGAASHTLTLNAREVLNLSGDSNTLLVRKDATDLVNMGAGWTTSGQEMIEGENYTIYTQGAAILKSAHRS